ncbi:gluconate:H+ symporter [Carboxydochorda subterranea]|uniref:Gluconate:H+ symporter n=1 Tax=Carboxydichorda subterranea TaxID=3109565 RepID=A0ABZ1BUU5_9FIRM|nr:gluconate:H+ symporter [Limnochorda sp. L945t]WRP16549.1 gluconate:H+ symporter [Limnochorda sp. L945t]
MQTPPVAGWQLIAALIVGVAVLVYLILKTRVHAFLALILASALTGLLAGMDPVAVGKSITNGFGNTLGSIGIVIGFGVMMGRLLEVSGAAQRMAQTFLRWFGRGREDAAMAATGYVVSIPIFCDSGFVILSPLAKALSRRTGRSVITIGVALAVGLVATHHAVPPTPGPLAVAGIFNVDVGQMILAGLLFAIPVTVAGVFYARWWGRRLYQIPDATGLGWQRVPAEAAAQAAAATEAAVEAEQEQRLPGTAVSFAPIVVPVVLILLNTVLTAMKATGSWATAIIFLGNPVIAVGIGLLIALWSLLPGVSRKDVLRYMEEGVSSAGIIILVTGAGGALGQVLRDSGVGNYLASSIATTGIPAVLLPFLVATLVRLAQGSGTVAMITSASITAPILANLHVPPVLAAQAAALGAMVFSYFNDSYFWVVNRLLGVEDVKEQVMTWSVPTTIGWGVSLITLLIVSAVW